MTTDIYSSWVEATLAGHLAVLRFMRDTTPCTRRAIAEGSNIRDLQMCLVYLKDLRRAGLVEIYSQSRWRITLCGIEAINNWPLF